MQLIVKIILGLIKAMFLLHDVDVGWVKLKNFATQMQINLVALLNMGRLTMHIIGFSAAQNDPYGIFEIKISRPCLHMSQ